MADQQFTLLLVDDNPTNLALLEKIIELDLPQVRVLTASNGPDGLQLAAQERIDGAFIDVQMPEMSGLEMCRRLKAEPRTAGMPLVLITAHVASPEMRAEGLEVGAYDFISQPISNVEMLARVKVMLRLCEGERQSQQNGGAQATGLDSIRLRWFRGLLLSVGGSLTDEDQRLLQALAQELPGDGELKEEQLLDLLERTFPQNWRRTFCKLALLKKLPLPLLNKLSELEDVEAVFDYLYRHNSLLTGSAVEEQFSFTASGREFLRKLAYRELSADERKQVYLLASDWYQLRQDPLSAFACLLRGEQSQALSQLLSQVGLELTADKYRPELLALLAQLPEEQAVSCGWQSLYVGIGCFYSRPQEVDTWLELARARFVDAGDQRGELMVLTRQVMQFLVVDGQVELGPERVLRMRELAQQQLELLDPFNRLNVLMSVGLGELFYSGDLKRCEQLLAAGLSELMREDFPDLQAYFSLLKAVLGLFQGRYLVARAAMEQARTAIMSLQRHSFPAALFRIVACELLYASGDLVAFEQRRHQVEKSWSDGAFRRSAQLPLLYFYVALTEMSQGNNAAAEELIDVALLENPAARKPHYQSWLLQLRGLLHAKSGRMESAREDCDKALRLREKAAIELHQVPNLLLAGMTALELDDTAAAVDFLQRGLQLSEKQQEGRYRSGLHASLAVAYLQQKDKSAAKQQLGFLFDLLRRQRVDSFFALTPELVQQLLPLALTEPAWSDQLRCMARLWLDSNLLDDGRLVPLARLQTFGGYNFFLQGKNCELSKAGQASRQLLALLAVSPDRALSSELIMGTLWPESPTSKARNSFDSSLSRLRKALETVFGKQIREDYLILEKGMLLLRNLHIDAIEFAAEIEESRRHIQRRNLWQAELAYWRADRFWQGEFLAGFELEADLPYRSDQYSQLRLEQLDGLARLLEQRGDIDEAVRLLKIGLAFEPTHDGMVQKLLDIYQQRNEIRAIHQLLDNYRRALQAEDYSAEEIDELIATLNPGRFEG
ncbi:Tetratricopeptide repeat-containing protein [Malonomonas rubra DSM 5091]|uniref:Tetratricopeptide repeat-containing protein n=1 Tax=Malonomonas rubra DSM 5091 TaxID=1122189 RepID=A0A1M6I020_MALRU|nr:response regulator [Malonomonas rubra]SHJ27818.1 Tetratricopeptide repeat-containing protein [Malonomonas rubra DSM 5091]